MIDKTKNTRISVTIPLDAMRVIDKLAADANISKSKAIAAIIDKYINLQTKPLN